MILTWREMTLSWLSESHYCPHDATPLQYAAAYYGHLGEYACPACGWKRPHRDVRATKVVLHGFAGVDLTVSVPEAELRVSLRVPGLYNVYNALAATAAAWYLDVTAEAVSDGLGATISAFGRAEVVKAGERTAWLLLIKNSGRCKSSLAATRCRRGASARSCNSPRPRG